MGSSHTFFFLYGILHDVVIFISRDRVQEKQKKYSQRNRKLGQVLRISERKRSILSVSCVMCGFITYFFFLYGILYDVVIFSRDRVQEKQKKYSQKQKARSG